MTYTVLLCDDEPSVGRDWVETVRAVAPADLYDVLDAPKTEDVHDAIKEIFARQKAPRGRTRASCLFDGVDILVMDYDLLHIDEANARHTGESLARLVRIFSNVEVVVVVNQFRDAQFDLSLLGHTASDADFNIDGALLGNKGLWTDPPWEGFRPWHWQTLYRAVDTQRARQAWVRKYWDKPIVEALDMREEDNFTQLSDTAFGFIASDLKDWRQLRQRTFEKFVQRVANGGRTHQVPESDPVAAYRFASARIGKWLERLVLGPQDALVDLPHLIQRFPFLLGDDVADPDAWNAAVHDIEGAKNRLPVGCWFEPADFLSKPAVWSRRLINQANFCAQRDSFDFASVPSLVFLEDTSTFVPIDEATAFRAGHHNFFDRRFAMCLPDVTYAPQHRLAFVE